MATVTVTLPADAGGFLRTAGRQLIELSYDIPDQTPTGAPNVLTIDNNPGAGTISFQVTSGAYPTSKKKQ
jgi:hypothetical protein